MGLGVTLWDVRDKSSMVVYKARDLTCCFIIPAPWLFFGFCHKILPTIFSSLNEANAWLTREQRRYVLVSSYFLEEGKKAGSRGRRKVLVQGGE